MGYITKFNPFTGYLQWVSNSSGSYSFSSPLGEVGGVVSISLADAGTDGYLSSVDWNTFNNKVSESTTVSDTSTVNLTLTGYDITADLNSTLKTNYDTAFTHSQVTSGNPHSVTLDEAFDGGKIIDGANSLANAFVVGNGTQKFQFGCYDLGLGFGTTANFIPNTNFSCFVGDPATVTNFFRIGGSDLTVRSDVIFDIYSWPTGGPGGGTKLIRFFISQTDDNSYMYTDASIFKFIINGDSSDYIKMVTVNNQAELQWIGCAGKITSDTGEISFDDDNITTTGTIDCATINTGQGDNKVYGMDQGVKTTDDVTFNSLNLISNTEYGSGWNGDTTNSPSKNAVYDEIEKFKRVKMEMGPIFGTANASTYNGCPITALSSASESTSFSTIAPDWVDSSSSVTLTLYSAWGANETGDKTIVTKTQSIADGESMLTYDTNNIVVAGANAHVLQVDTITISNVTPGDIVGWRVYGHADGTINILGADLSQ